MKHSQPAATERSDVAWYLAQCKPGQEHIAAQNLHQRAQATVFLPREERRRRWRGRWQKLLAPVFPGYVFVAPNPDTPAWASIRTARGLSRIVAFGAQGPARVPRQLIEMLRARCNDKGVFEPLPDLQPGAQVRMRDGPFADLIGRIESVDAHDRVGLLLELMGRKVRVSALRAELQPLPTAT